MSKEQSSRAGRGAGPHRIAAPGGATPPDAAEEEFDYDVLVVGSGFGGAVSALRLSEKGYRVGVLEAGQRFTRQTLPRNSWDLKKFLWAPALGCYGIQRIHLLSNVMILAGAGVGGGSLNYANTLYVPPKAFFEDRQWGHITDWQEELRPFYDQARRMLGARLNPTMTPSDIHLKAAADALGYGDTFHLAPVGVFFGDGIDAVSAEGERDGPRAPAGGEVPDPYFGGAGPSRNACTECGECMTGCRWGAKNTLNENYLYLAQRAGAVVHPLTTVVSIREAPASPTAAATTTRPAGPPGPEAPEHGWQVLVRPTHKRRAKSTVLRARWVVVAAGTYGTQKLLHRLRDSGTLPRISPRLGELTRTNSEALVGAQTLPYRYRAVWGKDAEPDFTKGVAITSSAHPNARTHIEPVRYGKGSNAMSALTTLQVRQRTRLPKALAHLGTCLRHPVQFFFSLSPRKWSERTIIGLVMQTVDNSLTTYRRTKRPGRGLLTARQGHGAPNPVHIPESAQAATEMADQIGGFPGTNIGELMNTPLTAHFLGGCPIGETAERGVLDPYHRLWGHPGISVVDGSSVSANLGVNPSLTITAQAERAMSLWPNKGDPDPRPTQGAPYQRLDPVAPRQPAVPAAAFGALRLTGPVSLPEPRLRPDADAAPTGEGTAEH